MTAETKHTKINLTVAPEEPINDVVVTKKPTIEITQQEEKGNKEEIVESQVVTT